MPFGLPWSEQFIEELSDKELRDEYVADQVRSRIALSIRALRDQRGLSQAEMGCLLGKPQSVVSRLENPDYGKESLQTLLEVAAALDLPLLVEFPEWDDWFRRIRGLSKSELRRQSFDADLLIARAQNARESSTNGSVPRLERAVGSGAYSSAQSQPQDSVGSTDSIDVTNWAATL
ncbi:transcriptional regulator with XRE-family HTH domain [Caulobacter ginsengisoli]|uniref:Transcriptional regulator with XRE-family HTH domain n=1 Tax=Caulobacter ginsengisoli TaxID=400775 RepID=A0ABU0IZR8_9CAUL|nr:XRE family transcriptional regulator [Caulobacter ginsengisoli]MDQ0466457.1 transcriptional regulator with XRE-family HTH domain [Caulobacter ginsengisoli]